MIAILCIVFCAVKIFSFSWFLILQTTMHLSLVAAFFLIFLFSLVIFLHFKILMQKLVSDSRYCNLPLSWNSWNKNAYFLAGSIQLNVWSDSWFQEMLNDNEANLDRYCCLKVIADNGQLEIIVCIVLAMGSHKIMQYLSHVINFEAWYAQPYK